MKTILLMFAILILAVSMIACGSSQKSQTQTTQTTQTLLGSWSGTITSTGDTNFGTVPFQFGAEYNGQYAYGSINITYEGCTGKWQQQNQMEINYPNLPYYGTNFFMTGGQVEPGISLNIYGTITGSGTGNAATGTISLPSPCYTGTDPVAWIGTFTATRQP